MSAQEDAGVPDLSRGSAAPSVATEGCGPDFFERRVDCEPMPLLDKMCRDSAGQLDCAVACGMYRPISNDLKRCDFDLQVRAARTWFCHTHPGKACRGNALNLGRAVIDAMLKADGAALKPERSGTP